VAGQQFEFDAFDCARFATLRLRSEAEETIAGVTIASRMRRGDLRNIAELSNALPDLLGQSIA
jgi:hypothetical protein